MLNLKISPKRINEILNPYDGRKPNLPAIVTSSGDIAVSSEALTTYVYQSYGFLSTYYPDSFFNCFARHVELYQRSIDRIYYAWNADYDVLDNVNAYEERISGKAVDNVSTNNGKTQITGSSTAGNTAKESTITDTTPVTTAQNDTTTNTNTTSEQINDATITHNNSLSISDSENNSIDNANETNHEIYRRHGNIGVTKSTELIASEIDLRSNFAMKQLIDTIIEMCGVFYNNEV